MIKVRLLVGSLAVLLLAATATRALPQDELVIYLVRHAESELPPYAGSPPDPYLNEIGLRRASDLAELLDSAGLDHVFSTEYRRTWSTALPVAHAAGLAVEPYDPRDLAGVASRLREMRGRILVVGHSNTTPMLVEALGGDPGEPIDDGSEFDRLYTLTLRQGSLTTEQLRYGGSLPGPSREAGATNRDAARLASTLAFDFHSSFWFNLHDALYWQAVPRSSAPDLGACLATLSEEHRAGWEAAAAFYRADMGERNARTDDLMRELRFHFTHLSDAPLTTDGEAVLALLRPAAPAYQLCAWDAHAARNRAWLGELLELLEQHEAALLARFSSLYQEEYPRRLPVDIVSYGNWSGANTTGEPLHMEIGSSDPDIQAPWSLEILFHEGSHGVFGARWGKTSEALEAAFAPLGLDVGRDYWHSVLFFTTGQVTAATLHKTGYPDYEPYMVRGGVYAEIYPLLARTWQPYLDGEIDLATAAERFAEAVAEGH